MKDFLLASSWVTSAFVCAAKTLAWALASAALADAFAPIVPRAGTTCVAIVLPKSSIVPNSAVVLFASTSTTLFNISVSLKKVKIVLVKSPKVAPNFW